AGPDFEIERITLRAIDQAMAVIGAGLPAGRVASLQHGFAIVLEQHQLALEHVDELVLALMPMALGRLRAGRQARGIDAELVEAGGVAEPLARAPGHREMEGIRITGADLGFDARNIDPGHVSSISS